jgi:hypothetical protein
VSELYQQPDSPLGGTLGPPGLPEILRVGGPSPKVAPGTYYVEADPVSDLADGVESVWGSEIAALEIFLGQPTNGFGGARRVATTHYENALELWRNAYYCPTDNIVFRHRLRIVRTWSPTDFAMEIVREALAR